MGVLCLQSGQSRNVLSDHTIYYICVLHAQLHKGRAQWFRVQLRILSYSNLGSPARTRECQRGLVIYFISMYRLCILFIIK